MHKNDLWLPGHDVSDNYPALNHEQLTEEWQDYLGATAVATTGVLGAVQAPTATVTKVASIDLCEVVRETHVGLARLLGRNASHIPHFGSYYQTLGVERGHEIAVTTIMMNEVEVHPVSDITAIAEITRSWRADGMLTIANTATLPGCESATIAFLKQHMPDCFDGIVFPRNHDGSGPITKASALESVITDLPQASAVERVVHIDDAPHHIKAMLEHMGQMASRAFAGIIPLYKGNEAYPAEAIAVANPLTAFKTADTFLRADL
ncbi:MAG: hypothetical protein QFB87_05415 [Patescibacteria group bacterium]|nr:hypothetical protein [Patescibacteria group bacterium]